MAEDKSPQSGDDSQPAGDDGKPAEGDGFSPKLSAEEYAKKWRETAAEARKYRKQLSEIKNRMEDYEQTKLQAEGKKDEMIQSLQKKLKDQEERIKKSTESFARRVVSKEVEKEAIKRGCVKPEALLKLADLSAIEVDDDYNVASDAVADLLDQVQKENDFLFSKQAPKPKDGVPGKPEVKGDLAKLSLNEKLQMLAQNLQRR